VGTPRWWCLIGRCRLVAFSFLRGCSGVSLWRAPPNKPSQPIDASDTPPCPEENGLIGRAQRMSGEALGGQELTNICVSPGSQSA